MNSQVALSVEGTPTIFLEDGRIIPGYQNYKYFRNNQSINSLSILSKYFSIFSTSLFMSANLLSFAALISSILALVNVVQGTFSESLVIFF